MFKFVIYSLLLLVSLHGTAQKEIIGKVLYYQENSTVWSALESLSSEEIDQLNSQINKIRIKQGSFETTVKTDTTGFFKFCTKSFDVTEIIVNEDSTQIRGDFKYHYNKLSDTLILRISDKPLAVYLDSVQEPKFYNKYSEEQATKDYNNGTIRLLGVGLRWPSEDSEAKQLHISETYDIKFRYKKNASVAQTRIMYRYNQVMKQLVGIKEEVW